jgi:hypothetical protein
MKSAWGNREHTCAISICQKQGLRRPRSSTPNPSWLPALSNGYIVDGLESNDSFTNLNWLAAEHELTELPEQSSCSAPKTRAATAGE